MARFVLFSAFLFIASAQLRTQGSICTTPEDRVVLGTCDDHTVFSAYTPDTLVGPVKLKFHVLRKTDGSMDTQLLNDSLLNILSSQITTLFGNDTIKIDIDVISGADYIDNDSIYDNFASGGSLLNSFITLTTYRDTCNSVNVYFVPTPGTSFTVQAGYPHGAIYIAGNRFYDPTLGYHAQVIIHEIGHVFGLLHTFSSDENITRSNCWTTGDRLCDTPAHPGATNADMLTYDG